MKIVVADMFNGFVLMDKHYSAKVYVSFVLLLRNNLHLHNVMCTMCKMNSVICFSILSIPLQNIDPQDVHYEIVSRVSCFLCPSQFVLLMEVIVIAFLVVNEDIKAIKDLRKLSAGRTDH